MGGTHYRAVYARWHLMYPLQGCVRSYAIAAQARLDPASSLLVQKGRKEGVTP